MEYIPKSIKDTSLVGLDYNIGENFRFLDINEGMFLVDITDEPDTLHWTMNGIQYNMPIYEKAKGRLFARLSCDKIPRKILRILSAERQL